MKIKIAGRNIKQVSGSCLNTNGYNKGAMSQLTIDNGW
jgi:hypothetical protein